MVEIYAVTELMSHTAGVIKNEATHSEEEAKQQLSRIKQTVMPLPEVIFHPTEILCAEWQGVIERLSTDRKLIGEVLEKSAQAIEKQEHHEKKRLTPSPKPSPGPSPTPH